MSEKSKLFFNGKKKVIGMVHLLPLPGNAAYQNNKEEIVKNAIEDAHTLIDCGVDAIMLENFSDWPQYSTEIPLEAYSLMVSIATRIREFCKIPFGVNIEMNAFVQEWAMAYAVDADFIRFEAYVDNRAGSFGYIEACSTPLAKIRQDYPSDTMILLTSTPPRPMAFRMSPSTSWLAMPRATMPMLSSSPRTTSTRRSPRRTSSPCAKRWAISPSSSAQA